MAHHAPMLIEAAPKFTSRGGLFYVDFGIEGLPVIALSPHVMQKAIGKARAEYLAWMADQGSVALHGDG